MRKPSLQIVCLLACAIPALADPASKWNWLRFKPSQSTPEYRAESPLPDGWPRPGPFGQVARKKYPAYRAAFTLEQNPNGGFRRLFKHIKNQNVPMTAPVEMKLDATQKRANQMAEMAFLYRQKNLGKPGVDQGEIEVRDVPARQALSYAWQGPRSDAAMAAARKAIDEELAKQNLTTTGYRLLAYNSPFMPRGRQTHELQALLP